MFHEQYHPQDLLTPAINDGGVNKLNSSLTSLDFYLLDDIDAYLPLVQSKKNKNDLINDSNNDNSQHEEELFPEFDFLDFDGFEEKSEFLDNFVPLDELELEKWISQSSFPSPPMDTNNSSMEDTSSISPWTAGECIINSDMVLPPSPPLSSTGSSPAPSLKKPKLSAGERRSRKKGQNKSAAEKYRIKKKSERHLLLDRHSHLASINKDLKLEFENLTFRVQKLKELFVDFLQIDTPTSNQ
jgi:hypothetical protein